MYFTPAKVEMFLANLDSHSVTGPGSITACILNSCSAALVVHSLSALFTQSFALGQFPSAWKLGNIIAIHNHGGKTDPLNYRPFSFLPIISKALESIIAVDINSFLFSNGLIRDHQLGFRLPERCCFYSPNNGWKPSTSRMRSGMLLQTYLKHLIKFGTTP